MKDAGGVGRIERVGDLNSQVEKHRQLERASLEPVCQRLALQVLHDQKVGAVLMANVVKRADVRVRKRGDRLGFAGEALAPLVVG